MKKVFFYTTYLFMLLSVFACKKNNDEQLREDIIGSFQYVLENEKEMVSSIIEGVETFNEDGTVFDNAILNITFTHESIGEVHMKFAIESKGNYEISNSHIIYDYSTDESKIDIQMIPVENSNDNEDFVKDVESQIQGSFATLYKEKIAASNAAKIDELSEKTLIIKGPEGTIVKERITENN